MKAIQFLREAGIPESVLSGKATKDLNAMARTIDKNFKPDAQVSVSIETYTPKDAEKVGQFLRVSGGTRNDLFLRFQDGATLTAEGKATARALLSDLANSAADLVDSL